MDVFDLVAKITLDTSEYNSGLDQASRNTHGFGNKLKSGLATAAKVGAAAIGAATAATTAFAVSSVKTGAEFDASMSKVAAISGATGSEFDSLRDKAIEMGSKTQFSASESADALTYMAMAGWKTGDMLNGIEGIMNLAAASGENLATTSDIVTDALTAFGLTAGDSSHFADILAAASSNANTNVSLMGESFKYVAPVAGALGYTAEDVSIALGLMASGGTKASQAGTTLRAALTNMVSPTKNMKKVMDEYGISLTDADGNMLSLQNVMGQLRDKLGGLDEATQASAASMLFGKEAMSGMLTIINASDADLNKMTTAINECDGAAKQMADTMSDNLNGDIDRFNSALDTARIRLADQLTPSLREFVQFGTNAISTLSTAFQEGGLHGAMEALGTLLSDGLAMVTEKLPDVVEAGIGLLNALVEGISRNIGTISDTAMEIILLLANGLIEGLPQIADSAMQIITSLVEGLAKALPELIPAAYDMVLQIAESLTAPDALSNLINAALELIGALVEGLFNGLSLVYERGPEIVGNIAEALIANLPKLVEVGVQMLAGIAKGMIEGLIMLPKVIAEVVAGIIRGFCDLLGIHSPSTVFAEIGMNLIAGLLEGISNTWNSIVEFFSGAVQALTSFLSGAWEAIKSAASSAWEGIKSVFQSAWEGIQAVFSGAVEFFSSVWSGIQDVFSVVADVLGGFFSSAWEAVQNAWSAAAEFFGGIADGIRSIFEVVTEFLGSAFKNAWEAVKSAWQSAKSFFSDLWNNIKSAAEKAAKSISEAFKKGWENIKNAWNGAKEFFSGILQGILGVFSNVGDKFKTIGGNIVSGLKNGISAAWSGVTSWIGGKVDGLVSGVKKKLDIHSPSGVFAGIGANMALGLSQGWDNEYSGIKRQIENGLTFDSASIGVNVNYSGAARYGAQETVGRPGGWGNTTVNIYSPEAVDGVQAARVWKKEVQRMAVAYV